MATDFLVLSNIIFDEWATPSRMPFGGEQVLAQHLLPGGGKVVDVIGPQEADIQITGIMYGNNAVGVAETLDALRLSGTQVPLMFAGRFYTVIVARTKVDIQRFPQLVAYHCTCAVVQNSMAGNLGVIPSTPSQLIASDMLSASSIVAQAQASSAAVAASIAAATPSPVTTPSPGTGSGGIGAA